MKKLSSKEKMPLKVGLMHALLLDDHYLNRKSLCSMLRSNHQTELEAVQ